MRFPRNIVVTIALLSAMSLGPPQALHGSDATGEGRLESVTLQLKWRHQFQFAGYYAALDQGFYRDAGLAVTLAEPVDGTAVVDSVLEGHSQFGIGSSDLVLRRVEGLPVVALASIFQHSPLVLVTRREAGISHIHDIVGKRVMLEEHSEELLAYFRYEGISEDSFVRSPHAFDPSALINRDVDAISAYVTDELFLLREAGVEHQIFSPRSGGIDFYGDTLFTSEEELSQDPERVQAFVEASLAGWAYAFEHPDEIIDLILADYSTRHSREHLVYEAEQMRRLVMPEVVEIGYMNPGRWQHIANTYASLGMIPDNATLTGFLYGPSPKTDLRWVYRSVGTLLAVLLVVAFIAARFYRLNRAIRREISERKRAEEEKEGVIANLRKALEEINTLRGIVPICSECKKIRDDEGFWHQVESYIRQHSEAEFSHGICPNCYESLYAHLLADDPLDSRDVSRPAPTDVKK